MYTHTQHFMTLAPAVDRQGYLITTHPSSFSPRAPRTTQSGFPAKENAFWPAYIARPGHVALLRFQSGRGQPSAATTPTSVLTQLQLRGGLNSSHRRHFHFLQLIFIETLPDVSTVTVSTHWHNDLLGREALLADIVGSFIHSWPIFSLSSRKVNPLLCFPPSPSCFLFYICLIIL